MSQEAVCKKFVSLEVMEPEGRGRQAVRELLVAAVRMSACPRFFPNSGAVIALAVVLLSAGCDPNPSVEERKFRLLLEENTRLVHAVSAQDPKYQAMGSYDELADSGEVKFSPEVAKQLALQNDRLREVLAINLREDFTQPVVLQRELFRDLG